MPTPNNERVISRAGQIRSATAPKTRPVIAMPFDCFVHNATIPKIIAKSGIKYKQWQPMIDKKPKINDVIAKPEDFFSSW